MRRVRVLSPMLSLAALGLFSHVALAGHCATPTDVVAVPGSPGAFKVTLPRGGSVIKRVAPQSGATGTGFYQINALDFTWDADNNASTLQDTLIVPIGSTVRWHLVSGIHTITNGHDSADPQAATKFDYLLTSGSPNFDSTFTQPTIVYFFCFFHEPDMAGALIVQQNVGVPGAAPLTTPAFSRPPSPNPSRGPVSFAVTVPRDVDAELSVLDVAGRRVATVMRGRLTTGEHALVWDGRTASGERAAAGHYRLWFRAGGTMQSRGFTLLR